MKRRSLGALAVILASLASVITGSAAASGCATAPSAGGEWPIYGHDFNNSRSQDAEHVISPSNAGTLEPGWTFSSTAAGGSGAIDGTPVVSGGCAFVGTETGWVFAVNADTGALAWKTKLDSGVLSSIAVSGGRVFAAESITSDFTVGPRLAALDEDTGALLWETVVNDYLGSDIYASPVVYEGMVVVGVGANSIEGDPDFHGSVVFLDEVNGTILHRTWTIPPGVWSQGFSGGGIWSTPAIDGDGYGYFGTGNQFNSGAQEYGTTNGIIKVDLDRARTTFGDIVATFKGTQDQYFFAQRTPCAAAGELPDPTGRFLRLAACEFLDLDFGASPNLFVQDGRLLVGGNQKGVFHAADAATMAPRWSQIVGPPLALTNATSSAFVDGVLYGSANPPSWVYALNGRDGAFKWAAPHTGVNDVRHYEPTSVANGVVYQLDGNGILNVFAASDGSSLLRRPMSADVGATSISSQSGGVSIARNTVYAASGEYLVAYRTT